MKENKRKEIKSNKYEHLRFKENGMNIAEMEFIAERNKILTEKKYIVENAMIIKGYYDSVIILQKEEMKKLTEELKELHIGYSNKSINNREKALCED